MAKNQRNTGRSRIAILIVIPIAVAAIALRTYKIDFLSFQTSEASFVALAHRSIAGIRSELLHSCWMSPLYFFLLHYWTEAFRWASMLVSGATDAVLAVRSFNPVVSGLSVAVIFAAARRMSGLIAAVVAGLTAAFLPYSVYASRYVSPYPVLELAAALVFLAYLTLRGREVINPNGEKVYHHHSGFWLFLALTFAFYAHPVMLMFAVLLLFWMGVDFRAWRGRVPMILAPLFGALLAYTPWLWLASKSERNCSMLDIGHTVSPLLLLREFVSTLTVRHSEAFDLFGAGWLNFESILGIAPFAVVLLVAFILAIKGEREQWLPLFWLVVPLIGWLVLASDLPVFDRSFLLMLTPAVALLVGGVAGKVAKLHWTAAIALGLVFVLVPGWFVLQFFRTPQWWGINWSRIVDRISEVGETGDVLVVPEPDKLPPLSWPEGKFDVVTLPLAETESESAARLEKIMKTHKRIMTLRDPNVLAPNLNEVIALLSDQGFASDDYGIAEQFRVPFSIYYTSRMKAFKALWKSFDPFIDFKTGNYHSSQLAGEIRMIDGDWPFVGKTARFYVRLPEGGKTVKLVAKTDLTYHGGRPFTFYLLADGTPVKAFRFVDSGTQEFEAELPEIKGQIVELGIYSKALYSPDGDPEPKKETRRSFQLERIGIE